MWWCGNNPGKFGRNGESILDKDIFNESHSGMKDIVNLGNGRTFWELKGMGWVVGRVAEVGSQIGTI